MVRSIVAGQGSYLPKNAVSNDELSRTLDTTDEWILQRTGIRVRHIAGPGEKTSDLATEAARRAMDRAGVAAADIDLIVLATSTPDETFPSVATRVQANLGITQGAAFDVQAVCSGFVYALAVADNFVKAGQAACVLVIGAETFSRILDWTDRSTCVLFGDGAGAVVLRRGEGGDATPDRGILSTHLHADGRFHDILYVDGGPSSTQTAGYLRMEGKEVFRHAVTKLAQVIEEALAANGLPASAIDWVVPHQANRRIMEGTAAKFGIDQSKVVMTIADHANTSAASIPLALDQGVRDGRIRPGHLVLLEAIGGGLTWGAALVRW